ncbi:ComF family protein [Enterovibrio calviensis]|uniref:ComF family protein n=1 Tax=Enterovibrio calviensis TaxID=91359 RepID=UPI001FE1702D|nr:phosphoribosyltransferase family protein [Enterovibrio calviensis]
MMFRTILRALPLRCQLCHHTLMHRHYPWCETCHDTFPRLPRCLHCGLPTPYVTESCGRCLNSPPAWDRLICVGGYTFPYDKLLHRFKYQGHYWLAPALGKLLAKEIDNPAPLLLPVPMHWRRRLMRGFNHSTLLARALAKQLAVQCAPDILKRNRATRQQQGLSRQSRLSNLRGAFSSKGRLPEHVALVDDVVTTGATIAELCRLLRQQGVTQIDVYCLCRTPPK